jgi:hypothetical protein
MENTSKTVTCDVCEYVCSFVGDTGSLYCRNRAIIIKRDQFASKKILESIFD